MGCRGGEPFLRRRDSQGIEAVKGFAVYNEKHLGLEMISELGPA
jgi:hypothetical protein